MNRNMAWISLGLSSIALTSAVALGGERVVDLEDIALPAGGFYRGEDGAGQFTSRGAVFGNSFIEGEGFTAWEGFAVSNREDTITPGFINESSSIVGGGGNQTGNLFPGGSYAIGYVFPPTVARITLPADAKPISVLVTNTTYAYLSMLNGDAFADPFGGPSGEEPDTFILTVTGKDANGVVTGTSSVYLADFRASDPWFDRIADQWLYVNLLPLGDARTLEFSLTTTDVGQFGPNTPMYFALDNLRLEVPDFVYVQPTATAVPNTNFNPPEIEPSCGHCGSGAWVALPMLALGLMLGRRRSR